MHLAICRHSTKHIRRTSGYSTFSPINWIAARSRRIVTATQAIFAVVRFASP